jgi:hypothetical protein
VPAQNARPLPVDDQDAGFVALDRVEGALQFVDHLIADRVEPRRAMQGQDRARLAMAATTGLASFMAAEVSVRG